MADQYRTASGAPTAEARKKFGYKDTGSFPIWDEESATEAINKRGFAKSQPVKDWIFMKAAKYVPDKVKAARMEDAKQ